MCIAIIYKQYLFSFTVCFLHYTGAQHLYNQTQLVTKINLIFLFQKPVPFAVSFSRFQGMGSDVFCLSVHSICFTSFRSSYIMIIVFSSSMCLFQVTAWSKQDPQTTAKKRKKHQCDRLFLLGTYFFLTEELPSVAYQLHQCKQTEQPVLSTVPYRISEWQRLPLDFCR